MKRKVYLSIDIDFWNDQEPSTAERTLDTLFHIARQRHIPIVAVMNHHQLTPYVDKSGANELVNVDKHSDLTKPDFHEFSCGSWIAYVRWRKFGMYHWIHQHDIDDGECSRYNPIFGRYHSHDERTDWRRIYHSHVSRMPRAEILLKDCVQVGFVLSPFYRDDDLENVFRRLVKKYNIPYKKGRKMEDRWIVKRKPPFKTRNPIGIKG